MHKKFGCFFRCHPRCSLFDTVNFSTLGCSGEEAECKRKIVQWPCFNQIFRWCLGIERSR
uniref:Uncharacterized protein n=1 Tax=Nelumbo nucifera TaxID=4432 RepID=A0A822XH05_NELNU|nr:TPA_asm: hypothetical protein HUJ06_020970 [Nelumbo nucifera]